MFIENLIRCAPPRTQVFFYRIGAGAEVDLLLKPCADELWCIDIKRNLAPKVEKDFRIARSDLDPTRSLLVYWALTDIP